MMNRNQVNIIESDEIENAICCVLFEVGSIPASRAKFAGDSFFLLGEAVHMIDFPYIRNLKAADCIVKLGEEWNDLIFMI